MFVLVVGVGLLVGWLLSSDSPEVAEVGQPAPDFTVEVIDGGTFTLSEARGQPVVLNFWASWCGPCRTEIPAISAYAESHPDITVVGVSYNDVEQAARNFADEIGAGYPLALGTPAIEDAYPTLGLPATYIIDENGVVSNIHNGIVNQDTLVDLVG